MATQVKHRRGTSAEIEAGTPAIAELWFNTTDNSIHMGDGVTQGGVKHVNINTLPNYATHTFDSVISMKSASNTLKDVIRVNERTVKTTSYHDGWAVLNSTPVGGAEYLLVTKAEHDSIRGYSVVIEGVDFEDGADVWLNVSTEFFVEMAGARPLGGTSDNSIEFNLGGVFANATRQKMKIGSGEFYLASGFSHFTGDSYYDGVGLPTDNGVIIEGSGIGVTVIQLSGAAIKGFRFDGNKDNNDDNTTPVAQWNSGLSHLTIKGTGYPTYISNYAALYIRAGQKCHFHHIEFLRIPGDAIFIDGVTTPGKDDADTSSNCTFTDMWFSDIAGKAFSNEQSRTGNLVCKRFEMRTCLRGGLYAGSASATIESIIGVAIGLKTLEASAIRLVKPATGAVTRGMSVNNCLFENCQWSSIDVDHGVNHVIDNPVFQPYMAADSITQIPSPRLIRVGRTIAAGDVDGLEVRSARIQGYSRPDSREYQFIFGDTGNVKVSNVTRGAGSVPDNHMFAVNSGFDASYNGESVSGNGSKTLARRISAGDSTPITGAGGAGLLSTITMDNESRPEGLISFDSTKWKISDIVDSCVVNVDGSLILGGVTDSTNTFVIKVVVGTTKFTVSETFEPTGKTTTTFAIPINLDVPAIGGDLLDLEITVSGGGNTVYVASGTRISCKIA